MNVASVSGGTGTYTDNGLTDGTIYEYTVYAKIISTDSISSVRTASWIAGGSPVPAPPSNLALTNAGGGMLQAKWTNPSTNDDGTPLDDFDAVNVYEFGILMTTINRSFADTGKVDSITFAPAGPNLPYHLTAVDNESPVNESSASNTVFPPFSAPYQQDFESAIPGTPGILPAQWTNETDDDIDWFVDEGGTPSVSTGPLVDHTLGTVTGNYMYTEASSPNFPNKVAHLTTPFVDLSTGNNPRLVFWYHMFGAAMGELHVDVYDNGAWVLDVMTPLVGPQQLNQSDPWKEAIVDLSAYAVNPIQIRLRGITGSDYTSDMAIDDVHFDVDPTGIENPEGLPSSFAMRSNYPNPFNPSTTISYQVPRQSDVRIEIYNMLGQKVRTLINNRREPGDYEAIWNSKNDSGAEVGSGVYLYRMVAGDFVQVNKMILMK